MSSTDPFQPTASSPHLGPKIFHPRQAPMTDEDHRQLRRHLQHSDAERLPFLAHVLRHKITASKPLAEDTPADVAVGGARVTYSIDGGPAQTGLLNHRARTGIGSGVIPVCSLLGAALIGLRVGQRAPLLCEDGTIVSLTVLDVAQPA